MKTALAVAKVNLKNNKLAWLITLLSLVGGLSNYLMSSSNGYQNPFFSIGMYPWIFLVLYAVLTPAVNFKKFMNLNLKKAEYVKGNAIGYVLIALLLSALNLAAYMTFDASISQLPNSGLINLLDVFGWAEHGLAIAFFQQFAFLLLLAVVIHSLTTIQTFWYGIAIDIAIVAVISIFTPIQSLRVVLVDFFNLIIFYPNAFIQIATCLLLAVAIYMLNIIPIRQKRI